MSCLVVGKVSRNDIPKGARGVGGIDAKTSKGKPREERKKKQDRCFFSIS
jgi:hypothetical protein